MDELYVCGKLKDDLTIYDQYGEGLTIIPKNGWIIGKMYPSNDDDVVYRFCDVLAWGDGTLKEGFSNKKYLPMNVIDDTHSTYTVYMCDLPAIENEIIFKSSVTLGEALRTIAHDAAIDVFMDSTSGNEEEE